jgi:hypothetical protein
VLSFCNVHDEKLREGGEVRVHISTRQPRVKISYLSPKMFPDISFASSRSLIPEDDLGRPYDPMHIDVGVLRNWIHCCDATHGEICHSLPTLFSGYPPRSLRSLNLIDLKRECIATMPWLENLRYVALSYVWGAVETAKASRDNIS